jgi:hypothetical protein
MNLDIYQLAIETKKRMPWIDQDYLYKVLQQIQWSGYLSMEEFYQLYNALSNNKPN